jgi:type II secretory pathway pseudopilin PulG
MGNLRARSFVVIMIVISLAALILRFAIIQFVSFNITQNEASALETLKLLSTAIENYAKDHLGVFPTSLEALSQSSPPYIEKEYISLSYEKGYNFNCLRLETSGYTCSASPVRCNLSGRKNYIITTGQVMASEDCSKKE